MKYLLSTTVVILSALGVASTVQAADRVLEVTLSSNMGIPTVQQGNAACATVALERSEPFKGGWSGIMAAPTTYVYRIAAPEGCVETMTITAHHNPGGPGMIMGMGSATVTTITVPAKGPITQEEKNEQGRMLGRIGIVAPKEGLGTPPSLPILRY